ncbi:MAG: hypothetical protein MZV70_39340 [Desulfobacterales bacterium]|nr:hypothetical protein [Desulfobacterales bacterium]
MLAASTSPMTSTGARACSPAITWPRPPTGDERRTGGDDAAVAGSHSAPRIPVTDFAPPTIPVPLDAGSRQLARVFAPPPVPDGPCRCGPPSRRAEAAVRRGRASCRACARTPRCSSWPRRSPCAPTPATKAAHCTASRNGAARAGRSAACAIAGRFRVVLRLGLDFPRRRRRPDSCRRRSRPRDRPSARSLPATSLQQREGSATPQAGSGSAWRQSGDGKHCERGL